jgi:hypothetical protein
LTLYHLVKPNAGGVLVARGVKLLDGTELAAEEHETPVAGIFQDLPDGLDRPRAVSLLGFDQEAGPVAIDQRCAPAKNLDLVPLGVDLDDGNRL